jgi:2-dehydro-3-deoxy-L-rhamnonate dehydrogenase (NAD+)
MRHPLIATGRHENTNLSIYSTSKAAVIGLTKSAGKELQTTGVLVNAIATAVIATPMNDSTAGCARPQHQPDPDETRWPARGGRRACDLSQLGPGELSTGAVYDISGRATH